MTDLSPYAVTSAKSATVMPPPVTRACDFPIFACALSKLSPQLAIRAELRLAAAMRETARAECRAAGMVAGRLPDAKTEMQGKLSIAKPRPDRDAAVLACLSDAPMSAWRIQMVTGFSKSSVSLALMTLHDAGKARCIPAAGRTAAQWWRA